MFAQSFVRPLVATLLLAAVSLTLAANAMAQETASEATASRHYQVSATSIRSQQDAEAALARRAGHACAFPQADKGWKPEHRLSGVRCVAAPGQPHRCTARAICGAEDLALVAR